jgi:TonB family protein
MPDTSGAFDQFNDPARVASGRDDRHDGRPSYGPPGHVAGDAAPAPAQSADALVRLGILNQDAGNHAEAERLFAEALQVGESTVGTDDLSLVPALARLGTAMIARGAHDDAAPLLTRALAISEFNLGADHPDLVVLLNDLSRLYLKQNAYARAEPLLQRLLTLKRSKGEEHPEVATVLASLAAVRQGLGDHDAAEQLYRRVLRIREKTLAPNHFAVAAALEHLADACAARGKIGDALQLFRRALTIREQTLGVKHASLRLSRERIADLQLQASEEFMDDTGGEETHHPPLLSLHAPYSPPRPVGSPPSPVDGALAPPRAMTMPTIADVERPVTRPVVQPILEVERPAPRPVAAQPMPEIERPAPRPVAAQPMPEIERPAPRPITAAPVLELDRPTVRPMPVATVAPVERPIPVPFREVAKPALVDFEADEERQQALVLPSSDGMLDYHDVLKEIEESEAANEPSLDRFAAVKSFLSTRRNQAAVGAGVAIVILLAAFAVFSNAGANVQQSSAGYQSAPEALAASATPVRNIDPTTKPATEAVPQKSAGVASNASVEQSRSRTDKGPGDGDAQGNASLQLSSMGKALPNVALPAVDSLARATDPSRSLGAAVPVQVLMGTNRGASAPSVATSDVGPVAPKLRGPAPRPIYPDFLRERGIEGEVVIQMSVDETGRPDLSTLKIVRSPHELLTAAVRKVLDRLRFEPVYTEGPDAKAKSQIVRLSFVFDKGAR